MVNKICTKCKIEKEINNFYPVGKYFQSICKKCNSENCKKYYKNNRDKINEKVKNYNLENKEEKNIYLNKYYEKNKEELLRRSKEYRQQPKVKERVNKQRREKQRNDPRFNIERSLRTRLQSLVKTQGFKKSTSALNLVGCSVLYLKEWIEKQFKPGMGWDNRKDWHIDHILPCNEFDLRNSEEQEICFHYTNLQPLWALDNLKKNNKVL